MRGNTSGEILRMLTFISATDGGSAANNYEIGELSTVESEAR